MAATSLEQPKRRAFSDKQKRFIDAYIGEARFNATEAARIAGYADPQQSGWENKTNLDIRARIDELLSALTLNPAEVLRELTDVGMRELHEFVTITRFDADGNPVSAKMDATAKIKSLELIGKAHGQFTEKKEITGPDGGALRIEVVYADPDADAS